jgi:hypothetical protein
MEQKMVLGWRNPPNTTITILTLAIAKSQSNHIYEGYSYQVATLMSG